MNKRKLLAKAKRNPRSLHFSEFVALVEAFGFRLHHVKGSHHFFRCPGVPEALNIQPQDDMAKAYQVRQFLLLVQQYSLPLGDEA